MNYLTIYIKTNLKFILSFAKDSAKCIPHNLGG